MCANDREQFMKWTVLLVLLLASGAANATDPSTKGAVVALQHTTVRVSH
jgi:hypothetical protein